MMRRMGNFFYTIIAFAYLMIMAAGSAEANDTLRLTFKRKDGNGVEQPLAGAYVYLRDAAVPPPMERYFCPPDYIFGPTDNSGAITAGVPQGTYFIRVTRRPGSQINRPLGPPEPGDYSWTPVAPIKILPDTITDLGDQYADVFGTPSITITGMVKDAYTGAPLTNKD